MSHQCLRFLSNRLVGFTSIFPCRTNNNLIIAEKKYGCNVVNAHGSIPFSTRNVPKCVNQEDCSSHQLLPVDNRELLCDIVTKENILFKLHSPDRWQRDDTYDQGTDESPPPPPSGRANPDQLQKVLNVLSEGLPKLFVQTMDYSIYHPDLVFENNIRGYTTIGLYQYVKQIALLRTVGHLRFAYVSLEVLKITQHEEDSSIKVRWRIKGLSAFKVMTTFWRYKLWNISEIFDKTEAWYDGFSTFYLNNEGLVVKHVADKMMPDSEETAVRENTNPMEAAKLALLVGIIPRVYEAAF